MPFMDGHEHDGDYSQIRSAWQTVAHYLKDSGERARAKLTRLAGWGPRVAIQEH